MTKDTITLIIATWGAVLGTAGCGSAVATSTGPSPAKCGVTLTAPTASINASGATTTVAVNTQPECTWNASSEASWITSTPASGQGAGNLQINVAANPGASSRQGNVLVNGIRAQISQEAAPCEVDVSATQQNFVASGGSATISVSAPAGCAWTAQSNEAWVGIGAGASGTGPGSVAITIASNDGGVRTASVVIANGTVRITQEGKPQPQPQPQPPTPPKPQPQPLPPVNCTYTASPLSFSISAAGSNTSSVSVISSDGCNWSASSNASWISINGASSGTANGTVSFNVASNSGAARMGTLSVAGQTVTVNQAASPCATASVTPTSVSVPRSGVSNSSIAVTSPGDCAWAAASNAGWISIASGSSGGGNGNVMFNVPTNNGLARTGTLTVAGKTVIVAQVGCTYTLSQQSISVSASGVNSTPMSVTTPTGCQWSVNSNMSWIVVSGSSGTGDGTFSVYIAPNNTGPARSGTLTVADQTVTVTQAGCVYVIAPTSQTIDSAGGDGGPVTVTTTSGCTWTAASNAPWIIVASGSGGKGNGTVTFSVAANGGGARMGTLTIAGQTFTVSQQKK